MNSCNNQNIYHYHLESINYVIKHVLLSHIQNRKQFLFTMSTENPHGIKGILC